MFLLYLDRLMICSEIKAGYSAISPKTYLPTNILYIYTYMHTYTRTIYSKNSAYEIKEISIVTEVQGFPAFEDSVKHPNNFPGFICLLMHRLIKNQQRFFKVEYPCCFCNDCFPLIKYTSLRTKHSYPFP
jgi:hypothetical protein